MPGAREVARRFALRIRTQAVLLSVVPLTFLIVLLVMAGVLQTRTDQTAAFSQRATGALEQSEAVRKALGDANTAVVEYTRTPRGRLIADYRAAVQRITVHGAALQRLVGDNPQQAQRATRFVAQTRALADTVLEPFLRLWRAGKKKEAMAMSTAPRVRRLAADWEETQRQLNNGVRALTLQRNAELHREIGLIGSAMLATSILGILLTLLVTGLYGLRIARRLLRLADNAQRLERDEPTPLIEGADEIADLDRVYHDMTQRIRETLRQKEEALAAYERAHHVASTLQSVLLPQDLPELPGLGFDGVYVPGRADAQVGGDWYDAMRLVDGRVLISIGDVAGSGLQAAVIMAAMREVVRGVAQVYADPATMIDAADRTLKTEYPDTFVTAFVGVYDPVTRSLTYCSAGHPPPLMRDDDGTVSELPSRGLPLGLRARDDADTRSVKIPRRAVIVFYTDGLIESTQDVIEGERRVRAALADPVIVARGDLARALHDEVLGPGAHDDVAILTMCLDRAGSEPEHVLSRRWRFSTSDASSAQRARSIFAAVLTQGGMFEEDVFTAELIFGELLSNAVRYASGEVEVVLEWDGAIAILHFLDHGPGFVLIPRLPTDLLSERGRGLFLVWSLSDEFNVTKRADGGSHVRAVLSRRRRRGRRPGDDVRANAIARPANPVS